VSGRGDATQQSASALAVFRNRPFLIVWLSQLATQVGGNMVLYGLTVLIFTASGSNSAVSVLLISFLAPAVIFGALAGVYVDRFDRRLVLVATSLIRAGLFLLVAIFDTNVGVILLLNLAVSIATTFFAPAELSMIPLLVPRGQLTAANGVFTLTINAAFALGFTLLGPLVVTIAGPTPLITVVAVLYLVSAGLCWTLAPAPPQPLPAGHDAIHEAGAAVGSVIGQFREGIAYIRANPGKLNYAGATSTGTMAAIQLASYANYGSFVDLALPGASVVYLGDQAYVVQGTSSSTAYASGIAAGTKSVNCLSWADIESAMLKKFAVPSK